MLTGPTPPTVAGMAKFDASWNGRAHRNVCVLLANGRAVVSAAGMPDFVLYYTPQKAYVTATEAAGVIEILTPDDPRGAGPVCLGIAGK